MRDYIHVEDLAAGHLKALNKLTHDTEGYFVYNLGTGVGYSVLEMIKAMKVSCKHQSQMLCTLFLVLRPNYKTDKRNKHKYEKTSAVFYIPSYEGDYDLDHISMQRKMERV